MASRTLLSSTIAPTKSLKNLKNVLNNHAMLPNPRLATTATVVDTSTTLGMATNSLHPSLRLRKTSSSVNLVKFTSVEGKRLFRGAMVHGHAESFFKLFGNFSTQSTPAFGGVSSLTMVLNALEIDPQRTWKGVWRWFSNEQLKTCSDTDTILERGMPFDEFTCLSQTYCHVEPRRISNGISYQDFLKDLERITSDTCQQMVVHYNRENLGQEGLAHFSPIGGYNKKEDKVLILDVARGKYPSVWVNTKDLYDAMTIASLNELGKSRGYFILGNTRTSSNESNIPAQLLPSIKCEGCTRRCHA